MGATISLRALYALLSLAAATYGATLSCLAASRLSRLLQQDHKRDEFHHSSFYAGCEVHCAGELRVDIPDDGSGTEKLLEINNKSGHYKPGEWCPDHLTGTFVAASLSVEAVCVRA